jgi:hypothetical protein
MSKWKDLGSGIMMWQPTADPEVDDMSIETLVAEGMVGIVLASRIHIIATHNSTDAQDGKIDAMEVTVNLPALVYL